jgi:hypothetical protein
VLDNRVQNMTPGEALLDVPMGEIIERLARSIAEAQLRMDQLSVRTAVLLGDSRLDMRDASGTVVSRSLLELGFTPTFYHFSETDIEVKVSLSIRVEESFKLGVTTQFSGPIGGPGGGATGAAGGTGPAGSGGSGGASRGATGARSGPSGLAQEPEQRASVFGVTINAEYQRKYEFNTSASSSVKAKMLAVPPPTVFLDAIRQSFRIPSP